MKKIIYIIFIFPILLNAQDISVKSFNKRQNDLDARIHKPIKDQNGEKCAIIKVVTSQKGFEWEGDALGIVKAVYKTGEYWLYVPHGAKRLTIKHEKLGLLRDYRYPSSIKEATVYELILTTGKVVTSVVDDEIKTQWMVITSEPDGASVYLNEEYKGETPFMEELPLGVYTYKIEYEKYKNSLGRIELSEANSKKSILVKLDENFGSINIKSTPENGARVYLDGEETGKVTPCTLSKVINGTHTITLKHKWYSPSKLGIAIKSKEISQVTLKMKPIFGTINITSNESSSIYLDDKYLGSGSVSKRLKSGYHTVRVKMDKHNEQTRKINIETGRQKDVNFVLKPKTGKLIITSKPFDATVKLNDKVYGTTPLTIPNLLVGKYRLSLNKNGYSIVVKSISINENKILKVDEKLQSGNIIYINTSTKSSEVYIDGVFIGKSPVKYEVSYGNHEVKVIYKGEIYKETINVNSISKRDWMIISSADIDIKRADDDYDNNYFYNAKMGYKIYLENNPSGYRRGYAKSQISKIERKQKIKVTSIEKANKREKNKNDIKLKKSKLDNVDFLSYDYKKYLGLGFTMARINPEKVGFYMSASAGFIDNPYYDSSYDDQESIFNYALSLGMTYYIFYPVWINVGLGAGDIEWETAVYPELGLNLRLGSLVLKYGVSYFGDRGLVHQVGIGFTYRYSGYNY